MSSTDKRSGWVKYSELVLAELKRHNIWLGNLDKQINNHITSIEHRLTKIETSIKNTRWMFGILLSSVIGIFAMVLSLLLN